MNTSLPNSPRGYLDLIGFTLVELVMGVLFAATAAALALPALMQGGAEARAAKHRAIYGSVRAAAQITRGAAQIRNQTGATGSVMVDGMTIPTVYGYPSANAAGIIAAAGLEPAGAQVTLHGGGELAGDAITVALDGARAGCAIVYRAPDAPDMQPTIRFVESGQAAGAGC